MAEHPISISKQIDKIPTECLEHMESYLFTRDLAIKGEERKDPLGKIFWGKAELWNLKCEVECLFIPNPPTMIICAKPETDAWNFGDCFPQMPGAAPENDTDTSTPDNGGGLQQHDGSSSGFFLRQIGLQKGLLIYAYTGKEKNISSISQALNTMTLYRGWPKGERNTSKLVETLLQNGLVMAGDFEPGELLMGSYGSLLSGFLNLPEIFETKFPVEATIGYKGILPGLQVQLPLPLQARFGPVAMEDAHIAITSPIYSWPEYSRMIVECKVEILDTRLRVEADLPLEGDLIIASASLLGKQQNFYKSPNPNILPDIGLDENMKIELAFSKTNCQLERVLLEAYVNNWHALPDPFEFRELALSVLIFPTQENLVIASFLADIMLDDIGLTFSGYYPSGPLTCSLDADTPLKLQNIGKKFSVGDYLPDLNIARLDFSYDFLVERVSALLYITSDQSNGVESWTHLSLQNVLFRFNGPAPYRAEAGAHLLIGTALLTLLGKYSEDGWEFNGSTGPGQQLPIGVFIKEIGKMFRAKPEIPKWLEDLTIKDLGLSFKTKNNNFRFTCEIDLPISDQNSLAAQFFFDITPKEKCEFTGKFDVTLEDKTLAFVLAYEHNDKADRLLATYEHTGKLALKVSDLFYALAPNDSALTDLIEGFDIAVDVTDIQMGFSRNKEKSSSLFGMYLCAGISISGGEPTEINSILFVSSGKEVETDTATKVLFGLNLDARFLLSSVPLVSAQLPSGQDIGIKDMQLFAASQELLSDDLEGAKSLLPTEKFPTPKKEDSDESKKKDSVKPEVILAKGLTVDALLMLGTEEQNLILASGESPKHKETQEDHPDKQVIESRPEAASLTGKNAPEEKTPAPIETVPSVKWIKVQKSIGPVRFDRLGFQYEKELVWFLIDASLSAAGLTISLQGFGIGSSLTEFKPDFKLQGLAINFKNDPVEISGAFLMTDEPGITRYSGLALIKAKSFMLSAVGSYEIVGGDTSLFVFAYLDTPLGGPPCFYVTGLAAGFGYNSSITIPSIQEVKNFPLLAAMVDPSKIGMKKDEPADPGKVLASMNQWIKPLHGSYWLAAGITFQSFEIINSNVLAIAQFGKEFQVLIVGLSTIQLPKTGKSYAYAELMIQITIKPAQGFIAAMAQLSPNSYLFDPGCHLTGGFAFYLWFGSSPYAGDFVLTIGGYHPAFRVPAHYPQPLQVPRVGFIWPISGHVTIKGEAYFALTPSCVMAGGKLEVLYQAGNLQAWFIAQADLIIYWKPFYFNANIYVRVGVSYRVKILLVRKTFRVELGASVELWGPPTGGRVHVSWWVISFTISFGAGKQTGPSTLDWKGFKTMLPQKKDGKTDPELNVIQINVNSGLLPQNDGKNGKQGKKCWIIRPDEFAFSIETVIPATETREKNASSETVIPKTEPKAPVGIRPMGIETITAPLTISIFKEGETNPIPLSGEWDYTPRTGNMPEAMWGKPTNGDQLPEAKLIEGCMLGINNIKRKPPREPSGPPEFQMDNAFTFFVVDRENGSIPESLPLPPAGAKAATGVPTANDTLTVIHNTLMREDIVENRLSIFNMLQDMKVVAGDNKPLKALAENPAANFDASPMEMTEARVQ
jgi:hypothetical protein